MDTDFLYLALSEKELYGCIREESKVECESMRTKDCKDDFTANATTTSFLEPAAKNIRSMTNESLVLSKRSFVVRKCCVYAVTTIVVMTPIPTYKISAAKV